MSYFVNITDFMRTTNLIFEAVWTPTLTSDTCITIAIAVTLIYTALFFFSLFYWGGGGGGGGRWVFSLFLLFFSCQHYFHFDFQNNKKTIEPCFRTCNLVTKHMSEEFSIRARSDEQEFLSNSLQMLHVIHLL